MRILLPAILSIGALGGCASLGPKTDPSLGIVQIYTQGGAGGHANISFFETPLGTVVVDVPLLTSEGKKLRKGIVHPYRIFVTAARPERYGSLAAVREGGVAAISTVAVAKEIAEHGDQRLVKPHGENSTDVPSHVDAPTGSIEERTNDRFEDVDIEYIPLGPAESESSLAIFLPKTHELITGDVVAGKEHMDLTWGRSVVWQDRIAELKALEPKRIYPGHGTPGGPELLDDALVYLKYFHDAVAEKVKPGAPLKITPRDLTELRKRMMGRFPNLGRSTLLDKTLPAEYAVQMAALPPPPAAPEAAPGAAGVPAATPGAPATAPTAPATTATPSTAPKSAPPADVSKPAPSSSGSAIDDLLGGGDDKPKKGGNKKKKKKDAN